MIPIFAIAAIAFISPADPTDADIVQSKFEDATFVVKVLKADQKELSKISKDFGNSYRFDTTKVYLKEALKLRMEAKVGDTDLVYIVNGFKRLSKIPRLAINKKEDLKNSPGKIQTPLDFGIVTPALFDALCDAKYVRTERSNGDFVFDITFKKPRFDDTSRQRVWVDPQKRYVSKREWYNQYGRQLATYYYEDPESTGGVWLPTKLTVKNVDGKIAGITEYSAAKVNTGLADSLFTIK